MTLSGCVCLYAHVCTEYSVWTDYTEYTLTVHFNWNTCTPSHLCSYLIIRSCSSSAMHKTMKIYRSRVSISILIKHQNGEEVWSLWHVFGTRRAGLNIAENADLPGFSQTTFSRHRIIQSFKSLHLEHGSDWEDTKSVQSFIQEYLIHNFLSNLVLSIPTIRKLQHHHLHPTPCDSY